MDVISRQAAIDMLKNRWKKTRNYEGIGDDIAEECELYLKQVPSAQPKRGKWIDRGEHGDWEWQADGRGKHWHEWECNTCHHYYAERSFFCPHCGSDMR